MTITWAAYSVVDVGSNQTNVEWTFYDNNVLIDGNHPVVKHFKHFVPLAEINEYKFSTLYYRHNRKLYDHLKITFPRVSNEIEDQYIFEQLTHKASAKPWDGIL